MGWLERFAEGRKKAAEERKKAVEEWRKKAAEDRWKKYDEESRIFHADIKRREAESELLLENLRTSLMTDEEKAAAEKKKEDAHIERMEAAAEKKKKAAEEKKKAAAEEKKKAAAEKKKRESFEAFCQNQNVPEELINLSDPLVTEIDDIGYVNAKGWVTIAPMIPIIRSILLSKNSENKLSIEDGDFLVKHIDQVQLLEQIANGETTMKEARRILQSGFKGSPEAVNMMLDGMSEEVVRKLNKIPPKPNSDFNKDFNKGG
jgi:hypothetical protein